MGADWEQIEDQWFSPARELLRLKRRAQARWMLVVGIAAAITAIALYKQTRPPKTFRAQVILRVTESELLRDSAPLVAKGLADYLLDAALPTAEVNELLERHDIFEYERELGPTIAAREFRDSLDVAVYRNYFAISRGYAEGARTARIAIRYADSDPDRALAIARDAAELMAATEAENRRRAGVNVARIGRFAESTAEKRLGELESSLAAAQQQLSALADDRGPEAAALRVRMIGLRAAVDKQSARVTDTRWRVGTEEFRESVASGSLGVEFFIVDERPAAEHRAMPLPMLAMLGVTLFILLLPLTAVAVGAFDLRVHDAQDVERLGFEVIGSISRDRGAGRHRVT